VTDAVARQAKVGLTVVGDGELGRFGHSSYVKHRLTGFEGQARAFGVIADLADFPDFAARYTAPSAVLPACTGPIAYADLSECRRDIARLTAALDGKPELQGFLTAASPGVIANTLPNGHYPDDESYLFALADAMRTEYAEVCKAGLLLQIDCPDLAMSRHMNFDARPLSDFLDRLALHVEALNRAVEGLPPDCIRLHVCWGNYEGPHHKDVALADIVEIIYRATPHGLTVAAGNPRHGHEWRVFEDHPLPPEKTLCAGVIDTTTNFVEHPDLVAERLERFASVVGPERLTAATDCGFATFADFQSVDTEIAWAKLEALAEGAGRASARPFGRVGSNGFRSAARISA
jgi:5-methyltetrahydropteroyltriglutamate--homocysteine methyltransferase